MGDKHFLLQNTLTGIILIIFLIIGIGLINYQVSVIIINFFFDKWQNISVLFLSPIIGIIIQGIYMFWAFIKGHPYQSDLRNLTGRSIKKIVQSCDSIPKNIKIKISQSPNNSLFMWILYFNTPEYIIEWGRRMRDFQHLGENWKTATLTGLILGLVIGVLIKINLIQSLTLLFIILFILSIIWVIGLVILRNKMKDEVEGMETIAICAYLIPNFDKQIREEIYKIDSL